MLLSTSRQVRLAVVTLLVIAAILMIAVIPFIGFDMVNPIVKAQQIRIEKFTAEGNPQAPLLALTVWLVSFFFPFLEYDVIYCGDCAAGDCTPLLSR